MVGSFNWIDVKMVTPTLTIPGCGRGGFVVGNGSWMRRNLVSGITYPYLTFSGQQGNVAVLDV
jgi:hypothetical protein